MTKLKRFTPAIFALLVGITQLCCKVVRKCVIPKRNRTGNILSSFFLLFSGLLELLIVFRQATLAQFNNSNNDISFHKNIVKIWQLGKRGLKYGVFFLAWLLFVLSFGEWKSSNVYPYERYTNAVTTLDHSSKPSKVKVVQSSSTRTIYAAFTSIGLALAQYKNIGRAHQVQTNNKIWLTIRVIRI